jgi:hypothetical protein
MGKPKKLNMKELSAAKGGRGIILQDGNKGGIILQNGQEGGIILQDHNLGGIILQNQATKGGKL